MKANVSEIAIITNTTKCIRKANEHDQKHLQQQLKELVRDASITPEVEQMVRLLIDGIRLLYIELIHKDEKKWIYSYIVPPDPPRSIRKLETEEPGWIVVHPDR